MFCSQCGTAAGADARFCQSCGASLAASQPSRRGSWTATASSTSRRPGWVWAITVFYILSAGWTLLSFVLIYAGTVPLTPVQEQYFASLGMFELLITMGVALLTLGATVMLFILRKVAVPLFGLALALNIVLTGLHAALTNWSEAVGGSGIIGMVVAWCILGVVFFYSRALAQRGLLR